MRHRPVQVQGHGEDRQLGGDQEVQRQPAEAGLEQATGKEVEQGSGHRDAWLSGRKSGQARMMPPPRRRDGDGREVVQLLARVRP